MLQLTPEQREQMTAHGEATYPHECCGFLIGRLWEGRKWVEEVRPAGNARDDSQSPSPRDGHRIGSVTS